MRIIHYEAEKRYVDAGMQLCTVFLLYRNLISCKVKKWKKTVDKTRRHNYNIICSRLKRYGEIPKRLKGLPWKGSRSLIAARGFKSLFLRFDIYQC